MGQQFLLLCTLGSQVWGIYHRHVDGCPLQFWVRVCIIMVLVLTDENIGRLLLCVLFDQVGWFELEILTSTIDDIHHLT